MVYRSEQGQGHAGMLDQGFGQGGVAASFGDQDKIVLPEVKAAGRFGRHQAGEAHPHQRRPARLVASGALGDQAAEVRAGAALGQHLADHIGAHSLFFGEGEIHRLSPSAGRARARR